MSPGSANRTRKQIRRLLDPASIAIVGASANLESFNGRVIKNLLRHGFSGKVYPVNPKYKEVADLPCYRSISDLPEIPETAFIAVGREHVLDVVRECAAIGVPAVTIYTAGFSEFDEKGCRLEEEIAGIAEAAGMRVCGPNTAGYHNFIGRVQLAGILTMEIETVLAGPVGVVCQSGSIGGALISRATHRGIGFSYLISCGNEADLEMADYVDFLVEDDSTRAIAIYLEGLQEPEKFLRAARRALEVEKPIVVCKVGRSAAGMAAAVSHTGALVGKDSAYEAVFRQWGVTRVDGLEELFEVAHMFAVSPPPGGERVGVLTTSGGAGALIADLCGGSLGMEVPRVTERVKDRIAKTLPEFIGVANPIDTTIAGINSFQEILRVILEETCFDVIVAVVGSSAQFCHAIAVDPIIQAKKDGLAGRIPLLVYFNPYSEEAHRKMAAAGVPSFHTTEGAARAAAYLWQYTEYITRWRSDLGPPEKEEIPTEVQKILSGGSLGEAKGLALAEAFEIRPVPHRLCADLNEAILAAAELGYPVVLKVSSSELLHKSEQGFVPECIFDEPSLRISFEAQRKNLGQAKLKMVDGYLVQKMMRGGEEFLLGTIWDLQFGPLITVGLGGPAAEVWRDVSVRMVPISHSEAGAMLDELRGARLLDGFRGRGPLDREALIEAMVRFGVLVDSLGERLIEADLNPIFVQSKGEGAWVADALFALSEGSSD